MDDHIESFMAAIEEAVRTVNDLETAGLIERYAIGGGAALSFHAEPVLTEDIDFFVFLPESPGRLIRLDPIYAWLKERGHRVGDVWAYISGVPVQFIPAYNDLTEEAVDRAVDAVCGHTPTRVFRLEHSLAVMLQTNRPKDRQRIAAIYGEAKVDAPALEDILKRHGLWDRWQGFWEKLSET